MSPLWLHHADRIVLVQGNQAVAEGTHEDLLLDSPDYRRVVTRAMDFDGQPVESPSDDDLETVPARLPHSTDWEVDDRV